MENYVPNHCVFLTYHRPGRKHWPEQKEHKEVEAGGVRPLFASESVQKASTDTAALAERPVGKRQNTIIGIQDAYRMFTVVYSFKQLPLQAA